MGDDTDRTLFLLDGLAARPAPVMLLVTDRELAAEFARRVHSEDGRGPALRPPGTACSPSTRRPSRDNRRRRRTRSSSISPVRRTGYSCRTSTSWPGRPPVGASSTAVLASTSTDGLARLRSAAPRLTAELLSVIGTDEHAELLTACLQRLDLFRLSKQLEVINRQLSRLPRSPVG